MAQESEVQGGDISASSAESSQPEIKSTGGEGGEKPPSIALKIARSAKNTVTPRSESFSLHGSSPVTTTFQRSIIKKPSETSTGSVLHTERDLIRPASPLLARTPFNINVNTISDRFQNDDFESSTSSIVAEAPRSKDMNFSRLSMRRITRQISGGRDVLVGTPIKEGHVNYMLMYDMLTGIRISVGRCASKPNKELAEEDFNAAHKLAFDVNGNELTPKSEYDFKFKDYSPWIFRLIRECFKVEAVDYLLSLTGKYVLSELGSPGKSGSFFYFSQDYRFIIKTIHKSEHKFIRRVLKKYYEHVKENPQTLLSRIFGLHRVKLPGNKKIHFVVMGNVFPANKDIHETYDLKGSTVGRLTPKEKARKPGAVLKDLNWLERKRCMFLGPVKRDILVEQMEKDVNFLISQNIMDYSLLIGIHDLVKGNSDNIRDSVLSVIEPSINDLSAHQLVNRRSTMKSPISLVRRQTTMEIDSIKQGASNVRMNLVDSLPERIYCAFYKELGGFLSSSETNETMRDLYYIGIIDIFTEYSSPKKAEHFFKSLVSNRHKISAVHPKEYGERFLKFMKDAIDSRGKGVATPTLSISEA